MLVASKCECHGGQGQPFYMKIESCLLMLVLVLQLGKLRSQELTSYKLVQLFGLLEFLHLKLFPPSAFSQVDSFTCMAHVLVPKNQIPSKAKAMPSLLKEGCHSFSHLLIVIQ